MSWRIDWYKADKNTPLKYIKEDNGVQEIDRAVINGEQLLNNEGTEFWTELSKTEKIKNKDLFIELKEDPDFDYFEVTKKGLEVFIEEYKKRVVKVYQEALKSNNEREFLYPSIERYHKDKLNFWEKGLIYDLNLTGNYELAISFCYEYSIFNLIALYKLFDFNNYKLVIYGG